MKTWIFSLAAILSILPSFAYQLRGTVSDQEGKPLPYVNVYIENTTYGVVTNLNGAYFLELKPGTYRVVYSLLGYENQVVELTIESSSMVKNVVLKERNVALGTVTVTATGRDPAYGIMEKVVANKKKYQEQFENSKCEVYLKVSLENETRESIKDSLTGEKKDSISNNKMNLVESYSTLYYAAPNKYKEVRHAFRDLADRHIEEFDGQVLINVGIDAEYGEIDPYERAIQESNPYMFYESPTDADFNFYQNLLPITSIGQSPFVSPLNQTALLSYKYKLIETFVENDLMIYKIEVIPRRKGGNFFMGYLYVVDEFWCLKAVDLSIDPLAMDFFQDFRVIQNYDLLRDTFWVLKKEEFFYSAKDGGKTVVLGNSVVVYDDYEINIPLENRFFRNELISYDKEAYERDDAFWLSKRPITLKAEEQTYIKKQDSINTWKISPMRLAELDSSYNAFKFWNIFLTGVGFRNSLKKREIYFSSLFSGMNFLGVGGYRHQISGSYVKEFKSAKRISVAGALDYGFNNKDVKGRIDVRHRYNPMNFSEIGFRYANEYSLINTFQSFSAILSRGNYVQSQGGGLYYSRELVNGLFFSGNVDYADLQPITDMNLSSWADSLFGSIMPPQDFEPFQKLVFDLKFNIRFAQKYYTTPYKKVVTGSKFAKLRVRLKWGVPSILGSDVDYGFIEVKAWDRVQLGTLGLSQYEILTGTFFRSRDYPFTENKFFRGSDIGFFAMPMQSFQRLDIFGYNTNRPYFEAHYIHNFQGMFMNKIPLLKRWRLSTAAGGGLLLIEDANIKHIEVFAGLEKQFRIFNQLFKIGGYYIVSESNQQPAGSSFKIGIDFYDTFRRKWTY